jgi:hypothetical protein
LASISNNSNLCRKENNFQKINKQSTMLYMHHPQANKIPYASALGFTNQMKQGATAADHCSDSSMTTTTYSTALNKEGGESSTAIIYTNKNRASNENNVSMTDGSTSNTQ